MLKFKLCCQLWFQREKEALNVIWCFTSNIKLNELEDLVDYIMQAMCECSESNKIMLHRGLNLWTYLISSILTDSVNQWHLYLLTKRYLLFCSQNGVYQNEIIKYNENTTIEIKDYHTQSSCKWLFYKQTKFHMLKPNKLSYIDVLVCVKSTKSVIIIFR